MKRCEIWQRVRATGVKHLCAFNYRFVPAVRLARDMLEAGELGEIYHFRGSYLQEWIADPATPMSWRLQADDAGSGALGDLGAHVIDLARYLVGEITGVSALTTTFVGDRPGGQVSVDDAFAAVVDFELGSGGNAGGLALLPRTQERSDLGDQRLQGLDSGSIWNASTSSGYTWPASTPGKRAQGFRTVLVSEADHPFWEHWWPAGTHHRVGAHLHSRVAPFPRARSGPATT